MSRHLWIGWSHVVAIMFVVLCGNVPLVRGAQSGTPAAPSAPNPPTGTAGVTVTPNLSWTSAGATSYDLLLGTVSPPSVYVSNITTFWYPTSSLAAGTTYYWQVVARNSSGTTLGPVWSFRTTGSPVGSPPPSPPPSVGGSPPPAPSAPNPPSGTAGVTVTPNLSWTSAGATSYDLLLGTASPPSIYVSNITAFWYPTSSLAAGTTYYWQVVAKNSGGTTSGPVWLFRTAGSPVGSPPPPSPPAPPPPSPPPPVGGSAPAVPSAPNPPGGTAGVTVTPNLSWTSAGATSYNLLLGTTSPPSIYLSNLTASWYPPSPLTAGTTYYWQVVASNSSGTTTGPVWSFKTAGSAVITPPPPAPPPPVSGSVNVPVIQWNIEVDDSSLAHAQLAMDLLVAMNPRPQIITIAEGWLAHFNDYIAELEKQTGATWYGAFQTHCPPGDWNGSTCTVASTFPQVSDQGVGIFSTFPITSTSGMYFPFSDCYTSARGGLRAALNVNGQTLQVFTTHLQTGGCSDDATARYNSMAMLKSWAGNYAAPKLVSGDFNATPDQVDTTQGMLPNFVDSWTVVGSGPDFTAFTPAPTMKLDFWFADASGIAQPTSSAVETSTGTVSDHYPLAAIFRIP